MSARFEELAWGETPAGEISLRRRREPTLGVDVYEVRLGEEFLMSSLFTVAEVELARLALARLDGGELDVLVGGLGLGYTARAVLEDPRVRSLTVVEAVADVIDWHRERMVPGAEALLTPRTRLVHGDFFAMVAETSDRRFDAVVVDIDHSPRHVLAPGHASFYTPDGLARLTELLAPGGVFALWSDDPPDEEFLAVLRGVLPGAEAHVVPFPNFYTGGTSTNTVYVAG